MVFNRRNFEAVQVFNIFCSGFAFVSEDHNGKVEVRAGKGKALLAFGGRHNAGQPVDFVGLAISSTLFQL